MSSFSSLLLCELISCRARPNFEASRAPLAVCTSPKAFAIRGTYRVLSRSTASGSAGVTPLLAASLIAASKLRKAICVSDRTDLAKPHVPACPLCGAFCGLCAFFVSSHVAGGRGVVENICASVSATSSAKSAERVSTPRWAVAAPTTIDQVRASSCKTSASFCTAEQITSLALAIQAR